MKLELIKFENGKFGIRNFSPDPRNTWREKRETFLANDGSFQFHSRRSDFFCSKCMFTSEASARHKLENYIAWKTALERDKQDVNCPIAEVLETHTIEGEES